MRGVSVGGGGGLWGRFLFVHNVQDGRKPLTASLSGRAKRSFLVLWLMVSELSSFRSRKERPLVKIFLGSFGVWGGSCMVGSVAAGKGVDWVWGAFWTDAR